MPPANSYEKDVEKAVVDILSADAGIIAAFLAAWCSSVDVRGWGDNSQKRGQFVVVVQCEGPEPAARGGNGTVYAYRCKINATPYSYIADDKNMAHVEALYKAVFSALNAVSKSAAQTALTNLYSVFGWEADTGNRRIDGNVTEWTTSRYLHLIKS